MKNYIPQISKLIRGKELAFFCGAGISKNSGLPLVNELKQSILEKLFMNKNKRDLKEDICKIMNSDLPFEAFIEFISEDSDISKILDIFGKGKPNTNHIMIARLAKNGYLKTIFTTNFDMLIEKALENEGLKRGKDFKVYYHEKHFSNLDIDNIDDKIIRIFKIHGSIEDKESIRTTLKSVASKTLSDMRKDIIKFLFSNDNHKCVLILGYSCSDEFDITPQIQSILKNRKEIFLVEHSKKDEIEDIKIKDFNNPFKAFSGIRIKCHTDNFIEKLQSSIEEIIIEEYKLSKYKIEWRRYVNEWFKELEKNNVTLKYFIVGLLFHRISSFRMAIKYHEKCLEINKEIGDKRIELICYGHIGGAYYGLGDLKKAIKYHEKCLEINKEIGDKIIESKCYGNLANAYDGLGDFKKAIKYYEKSLDISKKMKNNSLEAKNYANLGNSYYHLENFKKAIEYLNKSLEINKKIGDMEGQSTCYINLANAYDGLGDFKKAIKYYEKSLDISKKIGYKAGESRCLGNIGSSYVNLGDFKEAIKYIEKSLEVNKEIGDKTVESNCYGDLGNVFYGLGDFKKAIKFHEKSLEIDKEIGYKGGLSRCYGNLGNDYDGLGDFKKAIEYYLEAEKIFKETNQIHHLKLLYNDLSHAYKKIGDYRNAEKYKRLANFR